MNRNNSLQDEVVVINENGSSESFFVELWKYRYVFLMLAWRDILVRYRQTILGIAWALLTPLLTSIILTIVFSRFTKISFEVGSSYFLNVLSGVIAWNFFSSALSRTSLSFVSNSELLKKVYFPRVYIPLSGLSVDVIDALIGLCIAITLPVIFYEQTLSVMVVFLPVLIFVTFLLALAPGLILASLNVKYRDIKYTVPFFLQLLFFILPVAYPSSLVPEEWRALYNLNPLVGVIEGYRWALVPNADFPQRMAIISLLTFLIIALPISYFTLRKLEKTFADFI